MTDVILVAVIVAFFGVAALLVRSLGLVVADSADESGPEDAALEDAALEDAALEDAAPGDAGKAGPLPARDGRRPR